MSSCDREEAIKHTLKCRPVFIFSRQICPSPSRYLANTNLESLNVSSQSADLSGGKKMNGWKKSDHFSEQCHLLRIRQISFASAPAKLPSLRLEQVWESDLFQSHLYRFLKIQMHRTSAFQTKLKSIFFWLNLSFKMQLSIKRFRQVFWRKRLVSLDSDGHLLHESLNSRTLFALAYSIM